MISNYRKWLPWVLQRRSCCSTCLKVPRSTTLFHCLCCTLDNCWILVPRWRVHVCVITGRLTELHESFVLEVYSCQQWDWVWFMGVTGVGWQVGPAESGLCHLASYKVKWLITSLSLPEAKLRVRHASKKNHPSSGEHVAISRRKCVLRFVWWEKTKSLLRRWWRWVCSYTIHLPVDLNELNNCTVSNVLKSSSWQNRAHHFEKLYIIFMFLFSMCVCDFMLKYKNYSPPLTNSLPSDQFFFLTIHNLLSIVFKYVFNIIIICSIINTKKVKAGILAE